jgi:hypothetical protein
MKFIKQNISDIISIIVLAIALFTTLNSVPFPINSTQDNIIAYFVILVGTLYLGLISFSIYMRSRMLDEDITR